WRLSRVGVSERVAQEAARAAELLLRLTPAPQGAAHLSAYRAAFEARYGRDREVPLLELLDPNLGLGPPRGAGGVAGVDGRRLALRNETLQAIALKALVERRAVVELDDAQLDRLALWNPEPERLPLSLDLSVFVIASSAAAIDAGDFLVALGPNVGAGQAGRYLGRFADMLGRPAEQVLQEIAHAEALQTPDAIVAELVYLPRRLRSANVVVRPAVRNFEIPVGVPAGVPADCAIPLSALTVSVRNGRFRLRWSTRNKEVIVRAGHMLTNFHAPQICRFLDDIVEDGIAQLSGFDWGPAFSYPFLPRIVYRRCVLSAARWRIDRALRDAELSTDARVFGDPLSRFRESWHLPRHVYLTRGDNRLLLDLDGQDQRELLREELGALREGDAVVLHEALPGPEHAWLSGADGRYFAELVVPLVLRPFARKAQAPAVDEARPSEAPVTPTSAVNRLRPPGSDWLFVKLYCAAVVEEEFLVGPARELCDALSRSGSIDGWFFVRYADPDPHIRLRFRGDPNRLLGK